MRFKSKQAGMEWFKKHADTVVILGGILGSFLWMNGKFNDIEKEITMIRTVLIIRGIFPSELVCESSEDSLSAEAESFSRLRGSQSSVVMTERASRVTSTRTVSSNSDRDCSRENGLKTSEIHLGSKEPSFLSSKDKE